MYSVSNQIIQYILFIVYYCVFEFINIKENILMLNCNKCTYMYAIWKHKHFSHIKTLCYTQASRKNVANFKFCKMWLYMRSILHGNFGMHVSIICNLQYIIHLSDKLVDFRWKLNYAMKVHFNINIERDYESIFLIKLILHNPLPYL